MGRFDRCADGKSRQAGKLSWVQGEGANQQVQGVSEWVK